MAEFARIDGGPADGLAASPGAKFVWLEVVVRKRAVRTPGAGLYELRDGVYEYVGAGGVVCGCGVIYQASTGASRCPLCGAAALARTAPRA